MSGSRDFKTIFLGRAENYARTPTTVYNVREKDKSLKQRLQEEHEIVGFNYYY